MEIKMRIIVKLILDAEREINKELKIINKDIKDFATPIKIPSVLEPEKREAYFNERMDGRGGRLSTEQLTKNYSRKGDLERELTELENFKYHHKDWFE